ncbi:MAG: glycoside hydrolase family 30 beta sandwich domain-containing protein [Bacteroidota bacterium]
MSRSITLFLLLSLLFSCKEESIPTPPIEEPTPQQAVVAVYRTDGSGTLSLSLAPDSLPLVESKGEGLQIKLNPDQVYQEMEGFGAALTESSAYVLSQHLSENKRRDLLEELFSPEKGIGISYLRLTMGSSDFSLADYSYNDQAAGQADPNMADFTLGQDLQYVVPILQEILNIVPDLNIMATPWSAPAWMKSNQSLTDGGTLKSEFYAAYAQYFVQYLTEMDKLGISIAALTIQNEPLHQAAYPSMSMRASEQLVFIRDHLGPALENAALETKIVIYDHNWDRVDYPLEVLADNEVRKYIAGTAFHCYAGDVNAMSQLQQSHPEKGIYFTECSGGNWATDFGANLAWNMESLFVGAPRNWAKTVLLWNLALDENSGPQNGGCTDCRAVVTVSSNGSIERNVEYNLLGHVAAFVRPGACRIKSNETRVLGVSQVAFQNKDQSLAMVAYNHLGRPIQLEVEVGEGQAFRYELPAGMLVTFSWEQ